MNSLTKSLPNIINPRFSLWQNFILLSRTLRVKQWTKNCVLFAGTIFARQIFFMGNLGRVILAFGMFCLLSSTIYIFNDLHDLESDRRHPHKKFRPLASGAISVPSAIWLLIILGFISMIGSFGLGAPFFSCAVVYVSLMVLYTILFKKVVIIDIIAIAIGFVLRAIAGALVINVLISPWLLVCTFLLALFLGLTKRRQELANNGIDNGRKVLNQYPVVFLDQAISIITAATLTGYFLYSFSAHSKMMIITTPFVVYGILRYLLLMYQNGMGEEPERILLSDWPFQLNLGLWIICSGIVIYLG